VIYYLSRRLIDAETRYSAIEKLCLCLYFSCIKLRHYLLSAECTVICKDDVVRYMLSMPIMSVGSVNGFWRCRNLIYVTNRLRQLRGRLWLIL